MRLNQDWQAGTLTARLRWTSDDCLYLDRAFPTAIVKKTTSDLIEFHSWTHRIASSSIFRVQSMSNSRKHYPGKFQLAMIWQSDANSRYQLQLFNLIILARVSRTLWNNRIFNDKISYEAANLLSLFYWVKTTWYRSQKYALYDWLLYWLDKWWLLT